MTEGMVELLTRTQRERDIAVADHNLALADLSDAIAVIAELVEDFDKTFYEEEPSSIRNGKIMVERHSDIVGRMK